MKLCLQCIYCRLRGEDPGYSEFTPGSPAEIYCTKDEWGTEDFFLGTEAAFSVLSKAENCLSFDPAEWIKE